MEKWTVFASQKTLSRESAVKASRNIGILIITNKLLAIYTTRLFMDILQLGCFCMKYIYITMFH